LQPPGSKKVDDSNGEQNIHLAYHGDNPFRVFQFSKFAEAVTLIYPEQYNPQCSQKSDNRQIQKAQPSKFKIEELPNRGTQHYRAQTKIAKMVKNELYCCVISGDLNDGFHCNLTLDKIGTSGFIACVKAKGVSFRLFFSNTFIL